MTPTKNVELTDWSSERWTDNSDFIGPSVCGFNIQRKVDHICLLNMFLIYELEELLAMSDQTQLLIIYQNLFHTLTRTWDKGLSWILQCDREHIVQKLKT